MTGVGVAVAIHRDSAVAFAPRALRTEREAHAIATGFDEGAECALRAIAMQLGMPGAAFAYKHAASYCTIRNFLQYECDVDERVAARVAFHTIERRQRFRRLMLEVDEFARPRERGWI